MRRFGRPQLTPRHGAATGALVAALAVGLAGAPAAGARTPRSVHPAVVHLRAADRALKRLIEQPTGPLAAMYLARTQAQTARAADITRSIVAGAHGGASSERAATVLGLLADHQTSEAQALTSLLGAVAPEVQAGVARAITMSTGGREIVLGTLSGLLPALSSRVRPVVAQVVVMESSQGAQVPVQIAGVLGGTPIPCQATGAVQQALVVATQAFQIGLSDLGLALPLVPASVAAQAQTEIDGIPALLRHIEQQLGQVAPCSGTAGAPAPATTVAPLKAPALLGGMTQLIDGILGRVLPGLSGGQAPAPVAAPAPLAGLLGGLLRIL